MPSQPRACPASGREGSRRGSRAASSSPRNSWSRHGIPTARYAAFTRETFDPAAIRAQRPPIVVKADGLAAGKGVIIAASAEEAIRAAEGMFAGAFGEAGRVVVVEEFLEGEEASFIVMADGRHVLPLATSQDHKRLGDGDDGPNTGGMGAYSPAPVVTPALHERIMREVIEPTLAGLAAEGMPYTGFLYAGIMIAKDGTPNVLEFNCRFGDPGDAAGARAAQERPRDAVRGRARGTARRRRRPSGTRAPRSASCSRRAAIRTSRATGDAIERARRGRAAARQGLSRRHARGERDAWSPPADACSARSAWATAWPPHSAPPTRSSTAFAGMACSTGAI